jgi:hypothetical protein
MMSNINCEVVSKEGVNTIPETAQKVVELWNEKHFAILFGKKQSAGFGGVLTLTIVIKWLTSGHDAQVASQGKENAAMCSFVMMPNHFGNSDSESKNFEHHVLMHNPAVATNSLPDTNPKQLKKQRELNVPSKQAPLVESLKESDILEIKTGKSCIFTAKVLGEYCKILNIVISASKEKEHKMLFNIGIANIAT